MYMDDLFENGVGEMDVAFMRRALCLARCGEAGAAPNPMVGAVVVCDGRIVGEGFHRRCGGPHAEVNAIDAVGDRDLLPRCTLYVTLEPCSHWGKTPPCCDLIISSGLRRVVVGMSDPNPRVNGEGIRRMREAGIEVVTGVLEEECRELNPYFLSSQLRHRPYVTLKWAQTSDGVIGVRGGRLRISSDFGMMLVHRLRTRCQAIMVGTDTAINDNPLLTARLWEGRTPLRVTIDRRGRLPEGLAMLEGETVVYRGEILSEILLDLHKRGVQHLVVDGGARLVQSFIDEGLWDRARVELSARGSGLDLRGNGVVFAPVLKCAELVESMDVDGSKLLILLNLAGSCGG